VTPAVQDGAALAGSPEKAEHDVPVVWWPVPRYLEAPARDRAAGQPVRGFGCVVDL